MKIGIIGSGVSGLTAAHHLHRRHQVVLFEAETRPGGHAHTVTVMEGARPIPVDTGFIVFNTRTYPRFVELLGELGVGSAASDMSLSVRSDGRNFEYSGRSLSALFAQRRHLASPRFLRMVVEIGRFYREARELLGEGPDHPIAEWLRTRGYSEAFVEDHFLPMVRAIWSADRGTAAVLPARFVVRFLDQHGFLQLRGSPPWLTIPGGARRYVHALLQSFTGELRLGVPVKSIARTPGGAIVHSEGAPPEPFDHLILACHADQALALLSDASDVERELLGAFPYRPNDAVLHTDERLMPRARQAWSSWNVHLDGGDADGACLTYWMNRLQPLGAKKNYFVTLNRARAIRPECILGRQTFTHPVFTLGGLAAQARHADLIGHRHTSYVGAYWRHGFHEDGVVSALRVVERLDAAARPARDAA
jgi:uncharacterized protein